MVSLAQRRKELGMMTVPIMNADGSCQSCLQACGGGHCEYHKLLHLVEGLNRMEVIRSLVLPPSGGHHIPHNGCDLNHNEDRG